MLPSFTSFIDTLHTHSLTRSFIYGLLIFYSLTLFYLSCKEYVVIKCVWCNHFFRETSEGGLVEGKQGEKANFGSFEFECSTLSDPVQKLPDSLGPVSELEGSPGE